eukprot:5181136-Amphidinium_carterae.1
MFPLVLWLRLGNSSLRIEDEDSFLCFGGVLGVPTHNTHAHMHVLDSSSSRMFTGHWMFIVGGQKALQNKGTVR